MRFLAPTAALFSLVALGACQLLDSERLATGLEDIGATCHSSLGTYHLPRRLVIVKVSQATPNSEFGIQINPTNVPNRYVADRDETYCLDFLLSYASEDRIGVQRTRNGLLERVFTKVTDKTPEILRDTIQAVADLSASRRADSLMRSGARPQIEDASALIASFEFDPFVEREAREVNEALSEFGYCLYLDKLNDPFVPAWSEEICRTIADGRKLRARGKKAGSTAPPLIYKTEPSPVRSGLRVLDPKPVSREWQERGIVYRPELSHSLMIVRQLDPGSPASPWRLAGSERVTMPNAAPAFVMEVKRAAFVTAETDVVFNHGMLASVSVNKPSELLVLSNLTIAVAQIIVKIPARTFTIFNSRAENELALIRANADLIQTLRQHGADADANAQVRHGTDLILGRAAGSATTTGVGRSINPAANPAASRFAECLRNPDIQRYEDPVRVCQELVNRNL